MIPATPQNFRVVTATVKDEHHVELTVACDPSATATQYRWPHMFGPDMNKPEARYIATTTVPTLTFGLTPPFTVAPGATYTMGVEAGNASGWSMPNVQEFVMPRWVEAPHVAGKTPFATLPIVDMADSFQLTHAITGPNATADVVFTYDTGAYTPLFTSADAARLGLPNLGPVQVSGVGGSNAAYNSEFAIQIGPNTYAKQTCIVDPSFSQNLFGASFLINNNIAIYIDPKAQTISFFDA